MILSSAPRYKALFALLVEEARFFELDGTQKIKNRQVLPVIFGLLPTADILLQQQVLAFFPVFLLLPGMLTLLLQVLQDFNILLSVSEESRECFLSQWYSSH